MKKVINELIQLQELIEARAQQEALAPGTRLAQLDDAIRGMAADLPAEIGEPFAKLRGRVHVAIVPVINGGCTGCGMSLPVSLVHEIRRAESILRCPNCSRFLYAPETSAPRRLPREKWRSEVPKVGIARFSAPELMIPALESADRDAAIREIAARLQAEGFVDSGERLAEEALRRESILSTAVENGIAFPHARGVEGGGLTMALGLAPKGIRFAKDARQLTRIVFFVSIPTAASAFYLKLLAGLTKIFAEEENRAKLFEAGSPEKLWKALVQLTRRHIP